MEKRKLKPGPCKNGNCLQEDRKPILKLQSVINKIAPQNKKKVTINPGITKKKLKR